MLDKNQPVKVRIAPSPTGEPHVGTAYIGLFNLAFARKNGGRFILRIEDTDRERSSAQSERSIIESLSWLGIEPDEGPVQGGPCGPYRQSERGDVYRKHAEMLLESGAAYRCFCTRERLDSLRREQSDKGLPLGYDGHCRNLSEDEVSARLKAGEPSVVRLKMPRSGETVVDDLLRGRIVHKNELIDDQVLLKSDGFPTYHLANVVDDHLMGVTHVIRAEEWIPSTPKHVLLYRAFGWVPPTWIHMPLLRNPDKGKSKISKRKNPVSLLYYKRRGFLPEALLNFLCLMGWSFPGDEDREIFTLDEFIENFDIERVRLGGPVFDLEKLEWMNGRYLRALDDDELARRLSDHYSGHELYSSSRELEPLLPLLKERMTVLSDFDFLATFHHGRTFLEDIAECVTSEASLGELRAAFNDLRVRLDRECRYWNGTELAAAVGGLEGLPRKLLRMVLQVEVDDPAGLTDALILRGRGLTLKACKEAADTLKKLKPRNMGAGEMSAALRRTAESLKRLDEWTEESVEAVLDTMAEELAWKRGALFMPVRIACCGKAASPGLFETMVIVGQERCVSRLEFLAGLYERLR